MILTLAFRNLFHDRIRLAVTLVGILFSIVLVAVQLGLYLGASKMITANIDHADADLWIAAYGAKSFGYTTYWVNRFDLPVEELGIQADHTSNNLEGLLKLILGKP